MFTICKPVFRQRFIALVCAGLIINNASAKVSQDTLSLTLRQAEQQFLQQNLTLLAGHFNVEANRALINQPNVWDNPVLITDQNVYTGRKFFDHSKTVNGQSNGQVFIQIQQLISEAVSETSGWSPVA